MGGNRDRDVRERARALRKGIMTERARALRKRAEAFLDTDGQQLSSLSTAHFKELVHELNVHQVELEMQNEELREAQLELADSRDRYANLFEFAPVGYLSMDEKGVILEANLTLAAMCHRDRQALLGAKFSSLVTRESQDDLYRYHQALFSGQDRQVTRLHMRGEGDTELCVHLEGITYDSGAARRCHIALIDITRQQQAEEALRALKSTLEQQVIERTEELNEQRQFLDTVLANDPSLLLVVDRKMCVVSCNRAFEQATGYDCKSLQGSADWIQRVPAGEREIVEQRLRDSSSEPSDSLRYENHLCHRDGSMRLISWSSAIIPDSKGGILYFIGSGIDITEQRRIERQSRRNLEEASRLQRQHTVGELTTALAHELNQPLGAVSMFADACLQLISQTPQDIPLDRDRLVENLQRIGDEGERGGKIIRSMRNFIKQRSIVLSPLDLNRVVRNASSLIEPKARDCGVRLTLKLGHDLPSVMAAEVHLEQVLLNLLSNAIEAIHDAGKKGERVTIETGQRGGMARVTVRDGGPGINAQASEKIFEFLHSSKDYGLGVGLRISRSLIEAQGGTLWVEPQQPGGILHFEIPIAP